METAVIEVLKGVPVAAVLFYFAVQFRKDSAASQDRYENLVNKTLDGFSKQSAQVESALNANTKVMERVEGKLNEKH